MMDLVLDFIYPPCIRCIGCRGRLAHPQPDGAVPGLCPSCQLLIQRHPEVCPVCGRRVSVPAWMSGAAGHLCVGPDLPGSLHYTGHHRGILRHLIERYRDGGEDHLVRPLAFLMSRTLQVINFRAATSALVPIPSTSRRCRARGFDPVEILARVVGEILGVPTLPLLGCPVPSRMEFVLRHRPPETLQSAILIDDVYTGVGTPRSAAAALREAFSGTIRVAVLAVLHRQRH